MRRSDLPKFELPFELVSVDELGGEVRVQSLALNEYADFIGLIRSQNSIETKKLDEFGDVAAPKPYFGESSELLARTVKDDDGIALMSAAEWSTFGGVHRAAAIRLVGVAWRLIGHGDLIDPKKN